MNTCGRKPNENHVTLKYELQKIGNKYIAKCLICGYNLRNTSTVRLQKHRNICKVLKNLLPEDNLQHNQDNREDTEQVTESIFDISSSSASTLSTVSHEMNNSESDSYPLSEVVSPIYPSSINNETDSVRNVPITVFKRKCPSTPTLKKKQKNIIQYMDQLSDSEESKINDALSMFIFGFGLPFSVVESPLFKSFIKVIRPAYFAKIPGRKKLCTTLLDKCYEDCINKAKNRLSGETTILCDGWKNSSNNTKTVATMIQSVEGGSAFLNAWDLSTDSETAEKLAEILLESKKIAQDKYGVDATTVVSDNASAMVKMGSLVKHKMWHSTCSSHTGNLLAKDILDKVLLDDVVAVLKEFKASDFEKLIVLKGGHRIKLPADTRWCSYRNCLTSYLENLDHMKQIVATTKKKVKPKVTELIFNEEFKCKVQDHLKVQNPVCNLINICQSEKTSVADAANLWLNLELPDPYLDILKGRQQMALNIYSLMAYYFHPQYENAKLSFTHKNQINNFLLKHLNTEGIEEWDKFITKRGIFETLAEKQIKSPFVYWRMASIETPTLGKLALKLLQIPASSAQIERIFSNWGHVHSLLRNRLTFEKSKKLVHVYYELKTLYAVRDEEVDVDLLEY